MIVLNSFVRFTSDFSLAAVAALITDRLFGGIPFEATDEFDEMPGVRLKRSVFGLSASICGEGPDFGLRIATVLPPFGKGNFPKLQDMDLNPYVEQTLSSINEIRIMAT